MMRNLPALFLSLYLLSVSAQPPLTPTQFIQNGTGWATDLQSLASTNCYKTTGVTVEPSNTQPGMQESSTSAAIAAEFGLQTNLDVAFSLFQSTSLYSYLNNKTENYYTLTANYYLIISSQVRLTYLESGLELLNEEGAKIYDLGKGTTFRTQCGNTLITAYTIGAAVLTSVSLTFATESDMLAMQAQLSTGFGPYASLPATINTLSQQAGVQCNLSVTAQQYGGNDSPLAVIMASYTGNCISSDTTVCAPLITAIYGYILGDFATQAESGTGLIPLGGVTLGDDVKDCGLNPGQSILTPEILASQSWIINTLLSYQNWYNALTPIMYSDLTLDDTFSQELHTYYSNLEYSYVWISTGGTMTFTPQNCFAVDPTNCQHSQTEIMSTLESYNVTSAQLTALFESIQYIYQLNCAFNFTLYPLGNWDYIYEDVSFTASTQNFALQNGSFAPNPISVDTTASVGSFDYEEYNTSDSEYEIMMVKYNFVSQEDGEELVGSMAVYDLSGNLYNSCPGASSANVTVVGSINPYFSNFTETQINITLAGKTGLTISNN
jgi:hypothetical protein